MNENIMQSSAPAMLMRGGTSKGLFFLKKDLPTDIEERDRFLLRVMGSPDTKQIDGVGGATTLTSKVAIIDKSKRAGVDVDYLFLQVFVDKAIVTDQQNCGNILAGVGPFAIEKGLVEIQGEKTAVSIFMENSSKIAVSTVCTPKNQVCYNGTTHIDGVPGCAAPVYLEFKDIVGSSCGSLLPTGNVIDYIDGIAVTAIDNGMPCLIINVKDLGISGYESKAELDSDSVLKARLESIRLKAGPMMNLGDVIDKSVPKMTLVSAPINGGSVSTRSFIPHDCHSAIGVFAAVSVATACTLEGSVANRVAHFLSTESTTFAIEHPSGVMECVIEKDEKGHIVKSELIRTARKLFDGSVFS